jgi:hypothetical protein
MCPNGLRFLDVHTRLDKHWYDSSEVDREGYTDSIHTDKSLHSFLRDEGQPKKKTHYIALFYVTLYQGRATSRQTRHPDDGDAMFLLSVGFYKSHMK